jgi:diguanylate cyclase (GGDEF)-like protein
LLYILVLLFAELLAGSVLALDSDREISQYNSKTWGVDEQLPQVSVTALAQDSKGYVWVGTQSGIARFNGKEFVSFNRSNTAAFKSNIVKDILVDSQNTLWVLTENGIAFAEQEGFQAVSLERNDLVKPNRILEHKQTIIVASTNGLHKVVNGKIEPFLLSKESFALKSVNQTLYVGGRGQFTTIVNGKTQIYKLPVGYQSAIINAFALQSEGIWLATSEGPLVVRKDKIEVPQDLLGLNGENISDLHLDEQGILWIAAESRLVRYYQGERFNPQEKPSYHRVSKFMQDREGALWFGTSDRGLIRLTDSWSVRFSEFQGLKENLVWSVAVNSAGSLFVGTQQGIYKFVNKRFELLLQPNKLVNSAAYTLYFDHDDTLWVGTKAGLQSFNIRNENNSHPAISNVSGNMQESGRWLAGLQIQAIYRDSQSRLWVGTEQGMFLREQAAGNFIQVGIDNNTKSRSFRAIKEFKNQLYFGTQNGLLLYEGSTGRLNSSKYFEDSFVTSLIEIGDLLLAGSYGEGLGVFDGVNWHSVRVKQGLVFDSSFSLTPYSDSIWVSGFDGVYRLYFKSLSEYVSGQRKDVSTEPVLKDSGYLAGSEKAYCCNGAGHAKSVRLNDAIWYPTRKGVLKLQPIKVVRDLPTVQTFIEQINSPDGLVDMYFIDQGIHQYKKRQFVARDISFRFNGLTSLDEGLVKYQYRLIGYSPQWKSNGSDREVFYTNLPAGDYIFEVKASNREGVWAELPTSLEFTIQARYHETFIFKLAVLVASLILLYLFYLFIGARNKRKVEALEQLILKKTEALIVANQELAAANKQLTVHSYTDPLTGIHNRRYFVKQIVSDISHYVRTSDNRSSVANMVFILADIDFFKNINDEFGHYTGDEVLKQVVGCLQESIRDGDYLIRWGGEEFLLVLRPDHVSQIEELCDRLLSTIKSKQFIGVESEKIKLTISLGFSFYPMKQKLITKWSWEQAIETADKALYQAKHSGRNRWVGFQLLPSVIDSFEQDESHSINDQDFQRFSGSCPE